MKSSPRVVAIGLAIGMAWVGGREARAAFAPVSIVESIDNNGGTLTFNQSPFTGLIRNVTSPPNGPFDDRAIVAFDLSSFTNPGPATLSFNLFVNNAAGDQIRTFTISLFGSTGTGSLTDFNTAATQVGLVTLNVANGGQSYTLNLSAQQISAAVGGLSNLGIRFQATDAISAPSIVQSATLNITPASVPEPASIALMTAGLVGTAATTTRMRRRASSTVID